MQPLLIAMRADIETDNGAVGVVCENKSSLLAETDEIANSPAARVISNFFIHIYPGLFNCGPGRCPSETFNRVTPELRVLRRRRIIGRRINMGVIPQRSTLRRIELPGKETLTVHIHHTFSQIKS